MKRVVDYGAYVKLDEYEDKEGLIHISEISTSWVRNIRDHVREGQKLVLKVLRVNPQKNQVDLTLRRVTGKEKTDKMYQWKMEKRGESILENVAEKLGADQETVKKIRDTITQNHWSVFNALEEAVESSEQTFTKINIPEDWAKQLTEAARAKIKLERAKVRAVIELTCVGPDGVEAIKSALRNMKKIKKPKGVEVEVSYIGAPKYRLEVTAKNYEIAERTMKEAVEEALATMKSLGGEGQLLS